MKKALSILPYIVIAILALFLLRKCKESEDNADYKDLYEAAADTLHKTRNELGEEVTKTQLMFGEVENFKKLVAGQDSTLKKLQAIVDKKTLFATILSTSTSNNGTSATNPITRGDTVYKDSLIYIYPVYSTEWAERWSTGEITASKDSIKRSFKTINEFEVSGKYQKQGKWPFKKDVPVVEVKNKNPNTTTLELKSFALEPPKQRKLVKILVGAGIGFGLGYFVFHK